MECCPVDDMSLKYAFVGLFLVVEAMHLSVACEFQASDLPVVTDYVQ